MPKRVTIKDIANKVGLSTAAVTYALNGKPKISEEARKIILETVDEMGYLPNRTAQALARKKLNIGIVYPEQPMEFFSYLRKGIDKGLNELVDYKLNGIYRPVKRVDAALEMKEALNELIDKDISGLLISPGFNYDEYKEAIGRMVSRDIPVIYMVSDLPEISGIGCIRMNGKLAGRIVAQFMGFCVGKGESVAVLTGNKEIMLHRECVDGFVEESGRNNLVVKGIYETQDDKNIAYYLTEKLLKEVPDLKGLYVSSYNSVSVCQCIEDHHKKDEVFVIGQDLYPELVEKLKDGSLKATLFQDPFEQGRKAVRYIYRYLTEGRQPIGDILITPQLIFTSNLESYSLFY